MSSSQHQHPPTRIWVALFILTNIRDMGNPSMTTSPSMAPINSYQQDDDFLEGQQYAEHGKLMLLTVIMVFALFLLFLFVIPCRKRAWKLKKENVDSSLQDMVSVYEGGTNSGIQQVNATTNRKELSDTSPRISCCVINPILRR